MNYWNTKLSELIKDFNHFETGLDRKEYKSRLEQFGYNEIRDMDSANAFKILLAQFSNPLVIILIGVIFISFIAEDHTNAIVILVMLLVNTTIGFVQEYRAHKSLEKLKKLIVINAKVYRDGKIEIVNSRDIVPGDVVILNKGDVVPADIRLIETKGLLANESVLTGESADVEKDENALFENAKLPQDIKNGVFQGTSISSGYGKGIVVATATYTFLGKSVRLGEKEQKSHFSQKMESFTKVLFMFVLGITTFSTIVNVYFGRSILESLIIGILLALGITPETMPVIVSISLSYAASRLSKKKVLIKKLSAFEDLGNMDILCSDKTGTLTSAKLVVHNFVDTSFKRDSDILRYSLICNASNPSTNGLILQNSIDETIWEDDHSQSLKNDLDKITVTKAWDFSFENRMMGVLINHAVEKTLVIKGAPDQVMQRCSACENKDMVLENIQKYEQRGYRIIAIATKHVERELHRDDLTTINDLTLAGFVLLEDPPRSNVIAQVKKLSNLGVQLKIITGDSLAVTKELCEKVNLGVTDEQIISGEDLETLEHSDKSAYEEKVKTGIIFARVSPEQKKQIIEFLRESGHVVGYMGDGINDVGALRSADIGIAVDTATDVAKDSSDIILMARNLDAVATAITEGRKVFVNTMKFIFSTMSSSFGNVITITFASLFLPFLPLLPVQLLLLDFLSDFQHLAISTDNVDNVLLRKPKSWDMRIFVKYSILWGIVSTFFDVFHILVILAITDSPALFRTTWIFESISTEILATMALRTPKLLIKSKPSRLLLIFSAVPVIIFIVLSYTSYFDKWFEVVPMNALIMLVISGIVAIYVVGLELVKKSYYREFWGVG